MDASNGLDADDDVELDVVTCEVDVVIPAVNETGPIDDHVVPVVARVVAVVRPAIDETGPPEYVRWDDVV
jgi:hypothetical protein